MSLTIIDKAHLAEMAAKRCSHYVVDYNCADWQERSGRELSTTALWMAHRVYTDGGTHYTYPC